MDCYFKTKDKKEDYIRDHTETCPICNTTYMIRCHNDKDRHLSTTKCLRAQEYKYDKQKKEILLMSVKDLHAICKRTVNDDGTNRITNYTKMKKDELLQKMMAIYDLLVLSN
jgi:hypothetical protein